jgi:YbbR domain-containing protein
MITTRHIIRLVFRNIGWKLLSLVLAMLVWIAIHREPVIFSILPAPVQFKNAPLDLEISSEIVETVDIETRGPAELLRNLSEKRVAVVLDFGSVRERGDRTFTIERRNTNLPSGVEIVRIIPSQLHFTFERRLERNIPVKPVVSGVLPAGLHVARMISVPPELAIIGPESSVRKVTTLRTDPVDLNGMTADRNVLVSVQLPNSQVRFKSQHQITVKVSVSD